MSSWAFLNCIKNEWTTHYEDGQLNASVAQRDQVLGIILASETWPVLAATVEAAAGEEPGSTAPVPCTL